MITASVVCYHHRYSEIKEVIDCLLSEPVDIIYIIDNSSNDYLRELEKLSTSIRYIHSENLGYGAGHNIAIREAIEIGATYHIVVNPDIYFEKGVLEKLVEYMDRNPAVGQVMPQILYPNGKLQYLCKLLPTLMDLIGRRFIPIKSYQNKHDYNYELRWTGYDKIMEVPSLSGCFMFMRCSVLKQVGGFDERYFMYAEDLDLCRRIGEVSKTIFYPHVSVVHEYEKGSYKNKKLLRYHIVSVIKYFNKWGWFWDVKRRRKNGECIKKIKERSMGEVKEEKV